MKTNIKKYITLFIATGALSVATSCKDYLELDSPSKSSDKEVFESVYLTDAAVIGVYNRLGGDNGYGSRISTLYPQSADDFKTSGNYSSSDRRGISLYGATPDNSDLNSPFAQMYSGIERANVCIKYIPIADKYTKGTDQEKALLKKYYGEALALRAQFYYELIRNWGDVPALFEPAADRTDLYPSNANRDETYDKLLEDLKLAAELVPWRSESGYGSFRFTKGAIKGLRARIALARGGYSLRSDSHLMERRADYLTYYKIAQDECKEIMDKRSEHDLNPVYENIFKSLHTTNRLDDKHELMLEVGAYGTNATTDSKLGYYNGLLILANSNYWNTSGGIRAIPTYFYEFDQLGDCRRDVTIASYQIDANTQKVLLPSTSMTDGKFRKSWTAYNKTNSTSSLQNYGINWPLLRFADVLLMYAEANNELNNGPSADAVSALREVRARAYVGHEDRIPAIPTDKSLFFDAIVKERLLEFGGEGIRKYDLIRWNLMASIFAQTKVKLQAFLDGTGAYENVPATVYVKPAPYNVINSVEEVNTLTMYGGTASEVLFMKSPTVAPTGGYAAIAWRTSVNAAYISGDLVGFARYFEANKKELFPYYNSVLTENPNMVQNYGY